VLEVADAVLVEDDTLDRKPARRFTDDRNRGRDRRFRRLGASPLVCELPKARNERLTIMERTALRTDPPPSFAAGV